MLLGTLFVFLLSRTLAHPVASSLPPERPVPPISPVLNAFVAASDRIRDPSKIRSTWELVWNCLGTIFVCTYVAIHPNMPDPNSSKRRRLWEKVKMSVYALLAPEVVIVMALRQRGRNKAKGDLLTKAIVVVQTSWFVVQCIARHAQSLVITQLELVTLAFATLNIITYFLWRSKPLNAQYPIYFKKDGSRSGGPLRIARESLGVSDAYSEIWIGWTWRSVGSKSAIWQRMSMERKTRPFIEVFWKWLVKKLFEALFSPLTDMISYAEFRSSVCVGPYYGGELSDDATGVATSLFLLIGVLFGGIHLVG
ncbi:hypothetical protein AX16_006983 [Volvariella volvacea WC 439]|nr:hypothetical protein AX16_006983 [Volvariella volvacea WC 439]